MKLKTSRPQIGVFLQFIIALALKANAQPSIEWQKSYGGSNSEGAMCIVNTTNGGYLVAGSSNSMNGDLNSNNGDQDYWVIKLDNTGILQWQKSLGGTLEERASCIRETMDGGAIIAGTTNSFDGDVSNNHGQNDYWIVKLDSIGEMEWQKALGGTSIDEAKSIYQTTEGGYIVAGYSYSSNGNLSINHGSCDYWIAKLDNTGIVQWEKSFGGSSSDMPNAIIQTDDLGYIIVGTSYSNDGDVMNNHGSSDVWVIKLDSIGNIQWQNSYGGSLDDGANSVVQTSDNGYLIAASSESSDGNVSENNGQFDYWVIKLDSLGVIQWEKSFGGDFIDLAISIVEIANDYGYFVSGITLSNSGDVNGNHGVSDYWVLKLNANGLIDWQKTLGGTGQDMARSICQTENAGCIIAGSTTSNDGDVIGNHGNSDFWVVKLTSEYAELTESSNDTYYVYPNPANNYTVLKTDSKHIGNHYSIIDNLGRSIRTGIVDSEKVTIETGDLMEGLYFISISNLETIIIKIINN